MAISRTNTPVKGFSGSLGNLVFRQYGDKTILSRKGRTPCKQSIQQRENRDRFKHASTWAKLMMLNADKKAYYAHKAKKLKLPNAYTAAISDYMRKGEIKEIDTRQYKGKAGIVIRIKASKKEFAVNKINVVLRYADGTTESNYAHKKEHDIFLYTITKDASDKRPTTIQVMIEDHRENMVTVEREVVW